MNFKAALTCMCIAAGLVSVSHAQSSMVREVGVGTRAFSLANNYVAMSQDQSAVYWNPGALGFLPVREFSFSADVISGNTKSDFNGTADASDLRRLRLPSLGYMTSAPTSQGGLTFAVAIQSPYVFDDNLHYHGKYVDTLYNEDYRSYGNINFYTGAFGVQVAPGLGLGAAISLVSGTETLRDNNTKISATTGDTVLSYEDNLAYSYIGYDVRLGLLYSFEKLYRVGARLVLPQAIWYKNQSSAYYSDKGVLNSSFSGAVGASAVYPFLSVSTELRFRTPYDMVFPSEQIPDTNAAHKMNIGAGIGVELPLGKTNMSLRGGYSFDQYDPYTFAKKYSGETWNWSNEGLEVVQDRQLITGGIAYTNSSLCIEAGYGMQFWKIKTNGILSEDHDFSRFSLSMSFRY